LWLSVNRAQLLWRNCCDLALCGSFSPLRFCLDPEFPVCMGLITGRCFNLFVCLHFLLWHRTSDWSLSRLCFSSLDFSFTQPCVSLLVASSRSRYWFRLALAGVWILVQIPLSISRWSCRWTRFPVSPSARLASRFFPPATSALLARSSRRVSCHSSSWFCCLPPKTSLLPVAVFRSRGSVLPGPSSRSQLPHQAPSGFGRVLQSLIDLFLQTWVVFIFHSC
jgi:hypothetical protein